MEINPAPSREKIDAVARMQRYIAEHIREPITQHQLSQAAGYSEYYAAKVFKELTGKTPFTYIRRLRLSQAAIALRDEKPRVIDVAFDYVFDSHEGFTRAFSKEFGTAPKEYARSKKPFKLFFPSNLRDFFLLMPRKSEKKEEEEMEKAPYAIFVQIVERPARKVILKRGKTASDYFAFCEEVGCNIWGILSGIPGALFEPVGMWMPDNLRPEGTSYYTQGVEVASGWQGEVPEGFEVLELPPCKMLMFQGPPFDDEKFMQAIGALREQTRHYNPAIYGYRWADELAPRIQLAPMGYRGCIEGRPVAALNR